MKNATAISSLSFPWPPKELSPNARVHWTKKARVVKGYRNACMFLAQTARPAFLAGEISLSITFYPPNNRRRDLDNLVASFKAGSDGMASGWGVDDSRFVTTYRVGPFVPGGRVVVDCVDASMIVEHVALVPAVEEVDRANQAAMPKRATSCRKAMAGRMHEKSPRTSIPLNQSKGGGL